ncbi:hypothetical protein OQJ15_00075 [Fluoribacter dumoffii]|uniref:hypothetical protein n=1 Tax=Fluoribacter dumoffii TaxID=463 RepID=UPI0022444902|nr:hypothetical protein [Fluoribacter dumoffii]MCW8384691.1 hypothetical protein [Fluoribacter dumoffii]MCW8496909.1 hypothetical protein [Fluoribacter dumoffii]
MFTAQMLFFESLLNRYFEQYSGKSSIMQNLQKTNVSLDLSELDKNLALWKEIIPTLANNTSVAHLSCTHLPDRDESREFIKLLMHALSMNTHVKTLNLKNNFLHVEDAEAIAEMIKLNSTLKTLDLTSTGLEQEGVIPIAMAIYDNKNLKRIKLNECRLEKITGYFFQGLKALESLQELEMRDCYLEIDEILTHFLQGNDSLVKLDMSMNGFHEGESLIHLIEGLKRNRNLANLRLRGCCLDSCAQSPLEQLAEAISTHPGLTHLDFASNGLYPHKYELISTILRNSLSIKHLVLDGNGIEDADMSNLGSALAANHSLASLSLRRNLIGNEGLKTLGDALVKNNNLVHLDLTDNSFDSVQGLCEGLKNNISITSIDCSAIIKDGSWEILKELLQRNYRIKRNYLVVLREAEAAGDLQGMLKVLGDMRYEFYNAEEKTWHPQPLATIYKVSLETIKHKLEEQLHKNPSPEQNLLNFIDLYFKGFPLLIELRPLLLQEIDNYVNSASLEENEKELFHNLQNALLRVNDKQPIPEEEIACVKYVLDFLTSQIVSRNNAKDMGNTSNSPAVKIKKYYNQDDFIPKLSRYDSVELMRKRFSGLCELICNYIIKEDLMNFTSQDESGYESDLKPILPQNINDIQLMAGIYHLNNEWVLSSHILDRSSNAEKIKAYLFNKYPYALFSLSDVSRNGKEIDSELLTAKLNELEVGGYIKFMVFSKSLGKMEGHSMLIKKNSDNTFSFFDPNKGEYEKLSAPQLCIKLNKAMKFYDGTHMSFIDGVKYIKSITQQSAKDDPALLSRLHLGVMKIDPLDRQSNINAVHNLLSHPLFWNTKDVPPAYIKELRNILRRIDFNNELNIVKNILEIKRISAMEPDPDENMQVMAVRAVFNSPTSTTFANILANLNKEPQIKHILDELVDAQHATSHGKAGCG